MIVMKVSPLQTIIQAPYLMLRVVLQVLIRLHFTATDDCNNSSSCVRSITIVDSRPPVITLMAIVLPLSVDPDNAAQLTAWLNNHGGATASDDCSTSVELVWQTPELVQSIQGCGNTVTYIYRFRVADACGNLSAWTLASFSIIDSTDPTITTPASKQHN